MAFHVTGKLLTKSHKEKNKETRRNNTMAKAISINTEKLGRLTYSQFNKEVKSAGTLAAWARNRGVSPSTARTWRQRLNEARNTTKASV